MPAVRNRADLVARDDPPIIVVCQLLLEAIKAPVPFCRVNVGPANALGIPNGVSSGPIARTTIVFVPLP